MRQSPRQIEHYQHFGFDELNRRILIRLGPVPGYFVQTESGNVLPVPPSFERRIVEHRGKAPRRQVPRARLRPAWFGSDV